MQSLVILGTGGSAYDVLDIVEAINRRERTWEVRGFLDDSRNVGSTHLGLPILGRIVDGGRLPGECQFINAIGSDTSFRRRPDIIQFVGVGLDRFAQLVHPLAAVSSRSVVGSGTYIGAGVSIGGAARIGDHVSMSPGVIVGHDAEIKDFAMLAPAAVVSGFCQVGVSAYVGAGAMVRQRVRVGDRALIGMGAVVLRDVAADTTMVGNPARILSRELN